VIFGTRQSSTADFHEIKKSFNPIERTRRNLGSSVDADVLTALTDAGCCSLCERMLGHEIAVVLLCPAVSLAGIHQMRRAMWHVADRTRGRPAMERPTASVISAGEQNLHGVVKVILDSVEITHYCTVTTGFPSRFFGQTPARLGDSDALLRNLALLSHIRCLIFRDTTPTVQEAQLSQRDRARRRVAYNLVKCSTNCTCKALQLVNGLQGHSRSST